MDPAFSASNRFAVGTNPTDLVAITATTKSVRVQAIYSAHSQTSGSVATIRDHGAEEIDLAPGEMLTIKTEGAPNASLFWFSIRWFET